MNWVLFLSYDSVVDVYSKVQYVKKNEVCRISVLGIDPHVSQMDGWMTYGCKILIGSVSTQWVWESLDFEFSPESC